MRSRPSTAIRKEACGETEVRELTVDQPQIKKNKKNKLSKQTVIVIPTKHDTICDESLIKNIQDKDRRLSW